MDQFKFIRIMLLRIALDGAGAIFYHKTFKISLEIIPTGPTCVWVNNIPRKREGMNYGNVKISRRLFC